MKSSLFGLPTLTLAQQLLGKELIHETKEGTTSGYIVETEAYIGPGDRAAHSFAGRRTPRTEVMFGPPGYVYVYFIYGMHTCFNIVSGDEGKPEAILIRALQPNKGLHLMCQRRNIVHPPPTTTLKKKLTNGPGKLCQALGITMNDYGAKMNDSAFHLEEGLSICNNNIATGKRINISYAQEAIHYPYRFWLKNNPFVSK
ncbi:3-methyladenine DNA glycosylase [Fictibacillus macauensis ZFHKF-1]|uniref:Putative 3-methyladenine DNA glycosylase n=1 Tax=Fictibacillus macauensis ZFHKF-1 TaxID=1196324 RepID=I8AIK0_9BACL|nr:DNA-3-methyladenine glycosylase [Fictibacillus macauensis]EIT85547.1 3-methyladenine DNA glycosylase [Fictibacillus macauensis ZFHKF-1]